jgi:hypothetical protein
MSKPPPVSQRNRPPTSLFVFIVVALLGVVLIAGRAWLTR